MKSAKELYEQELRQRQANEAVEEEARKRSWEEYHRECKRREEEERRQTEKRRQEGQRKINQMNVPKELEDLSQSVQGHVERAGDFIRLSWNDKGCDRYVVVQATYDSDQQIATGLEINGQKVTSLDEVAETLAKAALEPRTYHHESSPDTSHPGAAY